MAKRKEDVIQRFVKQIERNANKLKKDLKRFSKNANLPHDLDELAGELRRGAASVASEVEHYLHEISGGAKAAARAKPARRKTAAKKRTRKAAKKTTRKTARKKTTRKAAKKTTRKTAKKTTRKTTKKRARKTTSRARR